MADQLEAESQEGSNSGIFYEYDSSSTNSSSCGSLETFIKEIVLAQAMFPEFFEKTAMKDLGANFSETSLAHVMRSASRLKKRHFTLSDEAIEIWYIKEYGLVTS